MPARLRRVGSSAAALIVVLYLAAPAALGQTLLTPEEQEKFLETARVVSTRSANKGVTGTLRATLSDGTVTHDASIQTVDISLNEFRSNKGVEFNFRDSWRYNIAAYRLSRLLQIGRVPPSVERRYNGKPASFTWWVDDVLMDEGERLKRKLDAPDATSWNRQMWHVRLFDQLIYNVDRNLGNLLIDTSWNVWMIDHTRAFRLLRSLKSPRSVTHVERGVLERLKALDEEVLNEAIADYLTVFEKRSLLRRRDQIVAILEKAGPGAILD